MAGTPGPRVSGDSPCRMSVLSEGFSLEQVHYRLGETKKRQQNILGVKGFIAALFSQQ